MKYDLLGIGIGPSNLSMAALLTQQEGISQHYFDKKSEFKWHPGLMLKDSTIQVSHLKDLVTLVDPTNPYSFLAFLKSKRRLYRALISGFKPLRKEMEEYYQWAINKMDCLSFNAEIDDVEYDGTQFTINVNGEEFKGSHLSIGIGQTPCIPECVAHLVGSKVYHASEFLYHSQDFSGQRVAVIGGGQTSAEIIKLLLSGEQCLSISWVTRRNNIAPMDDSPFVNEWFVPGYVRNFYHYSEEKKEQLLTEQKLSSDGVSMELLQGIYRQLYINDHISDRKIDVHIHADSQLIAAEEKEGCFELVIEQDGMTSIHEADVVILCTGYEALFPQALTGLKNLIEFNEREQFLLNEDYSLKWAGAKDNKIFIHNGGKHQFGVADPNLSLMSYRSATMINSLAKKQIYDLENETNALRWEDKEIKPVSETTKTNKSNADIISSDVQPMSVLAFGESFYAGDAVDTKVINDGELPVGSAFFSVQPKEESIVHHHSESEVWFVVKGEALVFCGDDQMMIKEKQAIKLTPNSPHKVRNMGDDVLEAVSMWWEGE